MKKFTMKDENFICENCGKKVNTLNYSARNHCPFCLHSKHVDIFPGDRQNICKGLLKPIGIEKAKKDNYKIIFKCEKCGQIVKNICASDDNFEQILLLSKRHYNF